MKAITVQISDNDYADLVEHLAQDKMGRALVAVIGIAGPAGSFLEQDVEAAKREYSSRTRTVTKQQADYIANKTAADGAYSADRYGANEWRKAAGFLAAHGFTGEEIETIMTSKWMRWAADSKGAATASAVREYIKSMRGNVFAQAASMVKEGK